jgi:RNA polymerase sigma-70 factor, ECF subfamily
MPGLGAMREPSTVVEDVFRQESGRIIATLIRLAGSFDLAEEAMQEAFATALQNWPEKGVPQNPAAWITAVAQRKLIDHGRRERTRREKQEPLLYETPTVHEPEADALFAAEEMMYPDDRLRLVFTCCHPALNMEAQVALTLRTLGGLSTPEIARAFLVPEPTLAQRLVRAKQKISEAHIPYEVPPLERIPERLAAVQSVIYLIFNEGYTATAGDSLIRRDLCNEAIRLGRTLCDLLPDAENLGLLALMLLHDSRRAARTDKQGNLVTLDEQDRSLWDRERIGEGLERLQRALALWSAGPYQLQAAISALHAEAPSSEATDWKQITALYRELLRVSPSPVVALNHAVAVALSEGMEKGLAQIDAVGASGRLDQYHLFHAARADILRRLGRKEEASRAYGEALRLATNKVEQEYLRRRLAELKR